MTELEIAAGIKLLCETSSQVKSYYENDLNIVGALNKAANNDLRKCAEYYSTRTGVVVDIRKELIDRLINKEIFTVESLHALIKKYKEGKENQFRSYKETFSIVFPAITFFGHNLQRDFVRAFTKKLIDDLNISTEVKEVAFDFQGVRQQGSERYWVAIYNKHQENQSVGIQFFFEFFDGKIGYGVYKHENQNFLKPRVYFSPEHFNYEEMISYFQDSKQILVDDVPKYENLSHIPLNNHKLYKISHGSFKANKFAEVIETFKSNNWIVIHENTGKGQAQEFKENLKVGDYVYITVGSKELIGIARVISNEWDYVPNDIVNNDGWLYKEVEIVQPPVQKKTKDLTTKKAFYPSANTTFSEIKPENLKEANELLFKPYFNVEFIENNSVNNKTISMANALNQILYGPPGTGKTYHTVLRAAEIIENRKMESYDEALEIFRANLHDRIEFITFHQNYSYEDFIQGLRPETDNSSTLLFEKKDGIFKRIADRAKHNPYFIPVGTKLKDYTVIKSNKDIVELWSERTESIRYVPYQLIEDLIDGINSNKISLEDIKNRRNMDLPTLLGSKVEKYYFGIESTLFSLCEFLLERPDSNTNLNYVIIIDEINRANISRVFGELITLIEPDKRSNGEIRMEARLPSGDSFTVPSNLYIIGTMNTADKSIALLDIALRRRFEFIPMYPKYLEDGIDVKDDAILKSINESIIDEKGHDFQIGHSYFMDSKEDPYNFEKRMNVKVIPLLLEYFMNDSKTVSQILNKALSKTSFSIDDKSWPLKIVESND